MNDPGAAQSRAKPLSSQSTTKAWLVPILVNIALPTLTYFVLTRSGGVREVPALLLSGLWPVAEIAYTVRT